MRRPTRAASSENNFDNPGWSAYVMPKTSPFAHLSDAQIRKMFKELDAAVSYAEGWPGLAQLLGDYLGETISHQAVYRWSIQGVPAERAVQLEKATKGAVLRQNLRPDLYDGMLAA